MPAAPEQPVFFGATDAEIDEIIHEFGGDHRQAIRALLHDLNQIARDSEAAVSKGFVRGNLRPFKMRETPVKGKRRAEAVQAV